MIDIEAEKKKLISVIEGFLARRISSQVLTEFAWEVIDRFTSIASDQLPPEKPDEKAFWYAIWQIQHMSDNEHIVEGVTKKALDEALEFLKNTKSIPTNYLGSRP